MSLFGFDQQDFNQFVLNHGVVGFFDKPVQLKSGRTSHWYVNWRRPVEDVASIDILTDFVLSFTKERGLSPNTFYGVPEGATKIGLITQYKSASNSSQLRQGSHALPMGRGHPKEHGTPQDRYFLGMPKGKTVVIEDVTTAGGSLLTTLDQLIGSGVEVVAAFGLTNRMETGEGGRSVGELIQRKGIPYFALSTAHELLPQAYERLQPGEHIARAIEEEFRLYGVRPLTLLGEK